MRISDVLLPKADTALSRHVEQYFKHRIPWPLGMKVSSILPSRIYTALQPTNNETPQTSRVQLLLSKPDRLLDRPREFLLQSIEALIRRQVQSIEASVRLGQLGLLSRLLDREAAGAVGALEVLEAVDGDARGAGCELQEARFLFGVPSADALCMHVSLVVRRGRDVRGGLTFQKFCTTTSLSV